jgi:hypothetical protein
VTAGAGVGGAVPGAPDDADLPLGPARVGGGQPGDDVGRADPGAQQGQPLRPVGQVGVGLRGQRADLGLCGRYGGTDGEKLAGHRDSVGEPVGRPGDDRERHAGTVSAEWHYVPR